MDGGAGDFVIDDLPIDDDGGGRQAREAGGGGELEVAFQLSSEALRQIADTKTMFLMAAGTLASDPHLASRRWWVFVAYISLFLFFLVVSVLSNPKTAPRLAAQRHHRSQLLAAACVLRALTLAFQAWCGLIPLNHLGAAVPTVLQVASAVTSRPLANC